MTDYRLTTREVVILHCIFADLLYGDKSIAKMLFVFKNKSLPIGLNIAGLQDLIPDFATLSFSEPSLPSVLNLRGQTLVLHEPIVLKPGRTYRVIGPGTLDADISGPASTTLWMTNCVVLNRAKSVYPKVKLKYHLTAGVYLNFININESLAPYRWQHEYLVAYDRAFNDVRFGGPDTLAGLKQLRNTEIWFNVKSSRY